MQTNEVIGYQVKDNNGMFVGFDGIQNFRSYTAPEPVSMADAYRRLAGFIEENPNTPIPQVVPVFRVLTPLETAARELGGLLTSLTGRHGLQLGLTQAQIERKIAQELCELGASPIVDKINQLR